MKTPMQELIEALNSTLESIDKVGAASTWGYRDAIEAVKSVAGKKLEKEKEVIKCAYQMGVDQAVGDYNTPIYDNAQEYYSVTFNIEKE